MIMAVQLRRLARAGIVQNVNARRVAFVFMFALLTVLSARLAIPLRPVPVTLQTLMVTLSGALLGPYLGAASQLVYLLAGAAGAPVFAMGAGFGYLFGPTGGYLLSYPMAAALTGVLCGKAGPDLAGALRIASAMFVASLLILFLGWTQLSILTGDAQRAFAAGVQPFIIGDVLKVGLGALIAVRLRPRTLGLV